MGRHGSSAVLKILNGSAGQNPGRVKDTARVAPPDKVPALPPWVKLDARERVVFDWLCKELLLGSVHGRPDGLLIVSLAQMIVLRDKAFANVKRYGPIRPHFAAFKMYDEAFRKMMFDLGFSPLGRMKHAPAMNSGTGPATDWDAVAA